VKKEYGLPGKEVSKRREIKEKKDQKNGTGFGIQDILCY